MGTRAGARAGDHENTQRITCPKPARPRAFVHPLRQPGAFCESHAGRTGRRMRCLKGKRNLSSAAENLPSEFFRVFELSSELSCILGWLPPARTRTRENCRRAQDRPLAVQFSRAHCRLSSPMSPKVSNVTLLALITLARSHHNDQCWHLK